MLKKYLLTILLLFLTAACLPCRNVYAVDTVPTEECRNLWEERKSLPVKTNSIPDWPMGPENGTEAAILMEVDTGTVLYAKNPDERLYPASTTKLMTALLVVENCTMEEVVTFSDSAIDNTEWGSSRIGIMKGEQLTVEQCLYGLLLGSANEVAYALAEHVAGDLDSFVAMMNERAAAIGCNNTHFVNASGLPDSNHYVSAHDLALIAKEFFSNETLCMISGSSKYVIPATNKTNEQRPQENHHKMITGKKYEYEGIIGGKTGYTSEARQTLVTCAQREGMKLICVVLKDEAPYQFLDSAELLDYGFASFKKLKIVDYETRYNLTGANFFNTKLDIMGSSKDILTLNNDGYVVIPKTMEFEDAKVSVDYNTGNPNAVCNLFYYVGDNEVGFTTVDYASSKKKTFEFANIITDNSEVVPVSYEPDHKTVFVTVSEVIKKLSLIVGILFLGILLVTLVMRFYKSAKRAKLKQRKRYKKRSENSHRNNYKKRSENKKRKNPVEGAGPSKGMYTQPMYKELSKRSKEAASADVEFVPDDKYYEENGFFDEEEAYNEEQMYIDFPEMEGYGVNLSPIDDPNRWNEMN